MHIVWVVQYKVVQQQSASITTTAFASQNTSGTNGNLSATKYGHSPHSSWTHGYASGGYNGGYLRQIDKFAFASNTTAADHGDLTLSNNHTGAGLHY